MVLEGGRDRAVVALHQGGGVGDGVGCHDGGAGVHTGLAYDPLDALGLLGDSFHVRIGIVEVAELLGLGEPLGTGIEYLLEAHVLAVGGGRQGLGHLVTHGVLVVHDPGRVLQGLLGLDGAVGHALGDLVGPVLLAHILQDLGPAFGVEIHIDIRQGHTLGVEETLEDQSVLQGVQLGDAHGVGHHGTCCGTTARTHHDAMLLGPVDVVGDHQEVAGELHLANHTALVVGLMGHLFGHPVRIAVLQSLIDLLQEEGGLIPSLRAVEAGHEGPVLMVVEHDVAALGDLKSVVAGFGELLEYLPHLLGRTDVVAGTVELESTGVRKARTGVDAEQGILCRGILFPHIMGVVGGHQRGIQPLGDLQKILGHPALDIQPVVHQLDVVVLLPEYVLELPGSPEGLVELPQTQPGLNDARWATGCCYDALVVGGKEVLIHSWPLAHQTLQIGQ